MVYIVMGVSGCGKTTIGRMLAERLATKFHDADDYHSQSNISKMEKHIALDDEDRIPWLSNLAAHIAHWNRDTGAVLACSALKGKYRQILSQGGNEGVTFIHLECDKNAIFDRMKRRKAHFFPLDLLESQLSAFEAPLTGITVKNDRTPEEACVEIIDKIAGRLSASK